MSEELLVNSPTTLTDEEAATADRALTAAREFVEQERSREAEALQEVPVEQQQQPEKDPGFIADNPLQAIKEVGAAVIGGGIDAVESLGSFADLTGDTLKTGLTKAFGGPIDQDQNPFSNEYIPDEELGKWLDVPDQLTPENKTGMGKLARGLVEFGILAKLTAGAGLLPKAGKAAQWGYRTSRVAGFGIKGSRAIAFIPKGAVIASEGAIADLVSNSSEMANIANLVNEHAPWIPFSEALAVDPEKDNPWLARIKTVAAGSGANLVGYGLVGAIRGAWAGAKKLKSGATVDESNLHANQTMEKSISTDGMLDELATAEKAADAFENGRGISQASTYDEMVRKYLTDDEYKRYNQSESKMKMQPALRGGKKRLGEIAEERAREAGQEFDWEKGGTPEQLELELGRVPDADVNPNLYPDNRRSVLRPLDPDPVTKNIHEAVEDYKAGGEPGGGYGPMWTDTNLARTAGDNLEFRKFLEVEGNKLAKQLFDDVDNIKDFRVVRKFFVEMVEDIWSRLGDGGEEYIKRINDYFKTGDNGNSYRVGYDGTGVEIVTANASQKLALQFVINSLGKQVQALGASARDLATNVPVKRQYEQSLGALRLAIKEHKKSGYMAGSELALHAGKGVIPPSRYDEISRGIAKITQETDEYISTLKNLSDKGAWRLRNDIMALNELSGGKVRTLNDIHEYLRALLKGGRMDGTNITGRWRTELRSVFYNSILSGPRTPVKAIAGTNLVGILRPFQAYYGAFWKGDKKQMLLAAAQIDALGKAYAEGMQMFIHNWKLGVNRKSQVYQSRFDFAQDIENFKASGEFFDKYGTKLEKSAFNGLNGIIEFNNMPWVRYTQNAMGAGDALARTIIGRYEMRLRSAQAALESGVDFNDIRAWAAKNEENFRREIFKQDENGMWVVSDKAARLAGDEAAMTKALEGSFAGLERVSQMPGMRAFFPFVRTGYNALRLTWAHTPLEKFTDKWHDIMKGQNLEKYGLRPKTEDLEQAQALMRGRVAMGNSIVFMGSVAAMSGLMTGDMPRDKAEREQWRLNKVEPNSFKFGDVYVSYKNIEPFNTILAATANVWSHSDALGDDLHNEMLEKLIWMTTAVIVDKSMLAGVEDLASVLAADTSTTKAERITAKYIRSHLPYSGLLAQVGEIMDANRKEADGIWETIWERDFIFKSMMAPKYDILSKNKSPRPLNHAASSPLLRLFNAVSPIGITVADNDPVKLALKEINFNMPEIMSEYKGVPLTATERSEISKYMAQSDLRYKLNRLISSKGWREEVNAYKKQGLLERDGYELYKNGFYQKVRKLFLESKRSAMRRLRAENPELAAKLDRRTAQHRLIGSGEYDSIERLLALPK